jgi:opacity protein-like surface antigen
MNTKLINLLIIVLVILTNITYAEQSSHWSIALKSSYFGDQSNSSHRLTAVDDPLSVGFQLRYFPRHDIALQFADECLNGKTKENTGEELNVQASLSTLFFPIQFGRLSPYIIYGLVWVQHNNNAEIKSNNDFSFQFGIGSDFSVVGNILFSAEVKTYTDGWNYQGWGTSFGIGYRL